MGTETIHPDWAEAPIVRYALDKAGAGADALTVLETLHCMMTDLEERAPGVPFGEILRAWDPAKATARGRREARKLIEQAGVDLELLDRITEPAWRLADHPQYHRIVEQIKAGTPHRTIASAAGVDKTLVYRIARNENLCSPRILRRAAEHERFEDIRAALLAPDRSGAHRIAGLLGVPRRLVEAVESHLVSTGELAQIGVKQGKGRPPKVGHQQVLALREQGMKVTEIAERLGCSKRTIAYILKEMK